MKISSQSLREQGTINGRTGEHVNVQVENRLPAGSAGVDDGTVTIGDARQFSSFTRSEQQSAQEAGFIWRRFVKRGDVLTRDDQQVNRGKGLDGGNNEEVVVFIPDFGRKLFIDDLAENAGIHSDYWLQLSGLNLALIKTQKWANATSVFVKCFQYTTCYNAANPRIKK